MQQQHQMMQQQQQQQGGMMIQGRAGQMSQLEQWLKQRCRLLWEHQIDFCKTLISLFVMKR